jgi:hypothetical protein
VLPTPLVVVVRRVAGEGEFDVAASFAFGHVERADSPLGQPFDVPLRDNEDGTYELSFVPHIATVTH